MGFTVERNTCLRDILLQMKNDGNCELYIFTNCRENEALECLAALGIEDLFPTENVIGSNFMRPHCKPEGQVFDAVSQWLTNVKQCHLPSQPIYFFEDSFETR